MRSIHKHSVFTHRSDICYFKRISRVIYLLFALYLSLLFSATSQLSPQHLPLHRKRVMSAFEALEVVLPLTYQAVRWVKFEIPSKTMDHFQTLKFFDRWGGGTYQCVCYTGYHAQGKTGYTSGTDSRLKPTIPDDSYVIHDASIDFSISIASKHHAAAAAALDCHVARMGTTALATQSRRSRHKYYIQILHVRLRNERRVCATQQT